MEELNRGDETYRFSDFFTYIKTLGSGGFGKVVHALDNKTGQEVAVKVITKRSVKATYLKKIRQEAKLLEKLKHPNIVEFLGVKETEKRIFIVMEMVKGGTLKNYICKNNLTEFQASSVLKGVLGAVSFIHSKNILHKDIKPDNILISDLSNLSTVKVADFGLGAKFDSFDPHSSGTLLYMAPEQFTSKYCCWGVDIWACGILLYNLCTQGKHPLAEPSDKPSDYLSKLKNPKWKFPQEFPQRAKGLFLNLCTLMPIDRYSATQALKHPWITRDETPVPLSSLEKYRRHKDILRLKGIVFSVFFGCLTGFTEKRSPLSEPKSNCVIRNDTRNRSTPPIMRIRRVLNRTPDLRKHDATSRKKIIKSKSPTKKLHKNQSFEIRAR